MLDVVPKRRKCTMKQYFDRTKHYADDSSRKKALDDLYVRMIVLDMELLRNGELQGFRNFVVGLDEKYTIPDTTTLKRSLLPKLYQDTKLKINNVVHNVTHVSLTTDIWTNKNYEDILAITSHFFNNGKLISPLLAAVKIEGRHTSDTIAQVHRNDGLPQKICSNCKEIIEQSVNLRNTSKKAEDTLLSMGFTKSIHRQDDFNEMKYSNNDLNLNAEQDNNVSWSDTHSVKENGILDDYVPKDIENDLQHIKENSLKRLERKEQIISDELYKYLLSNAENHQNRDTLMKVYRMSKKLQTCKIISLKCCICQKNLKTRNTLKTHLKWHLGIDTFICEACGKRCHNRTALTFHMRSRHGGERRDVCSFCQYRAINKEQLKIHERRHTGEKPYICAHCNSGFHRRANLVQHLDIHLTEKTVQCDLCPSKFKSVKFLRTHKNKIHRPRQYTYVCGICNNNFAKACNVRKHQLRIHGVPIEQQRPVLRVKIRRQVDSILNSG